MKKIIGILSLFLALVVLFPGSAMAAGNLTTVRGNVYNLTNGTRLGGLTVSVSCIMREKKNGDLKIKTKTAVTDSNGLYTVTYSAERCEAYENVYASVTYNGETKNHSVWVSHVNTATMDFYYGSDPVNVPEFGLLPGIVAAVASTGAYLGLKLKKRI